VDAGVDVKYFPAIKAGNGLNVAMDSFIHTPRGFGIVMAVRAFEMKGSSHIMVLPGCCKKINTEIGGGKLHCLSRGCSLFHPSPLLRTRSLGPGGPSAAPNSYGCFPKQQ
jgi:hypothetical protein